MAKAKPNLDAKQSALNKEEGMQRSYRNALKHDKDWGEKALNCIKKYPFNSFLAEDVRFWGMRNRLISPPPDGRAWGIVMREAAKMGIIERIKFDFAKSTTAHRGTVTRWNRL